MPRPSTASRTNSCWSDPALRTRALAGVMPFSGWPAATLTRLALAADVVTRPSGASLLTRGSRVDAVFMVVEGDVNVSLAAPDGRSVVFAIARPGAAIFGLASLIDGGPMGNDVVADRSIVALAIPVVAVRTELERAPVLWESVAREAAARARFTVEQLALFLFEPLRSRAVRVLLGLAATAGSTDRNGAIAIDLPLPQERLGEMLGVSRQSAAGIARELVCAGLVRWRYGRVTLVDLLRLRALAVDPAATIGRQPARGGREETARRAARSATASPAAGLRGTPASHVHGAVTAWVGSERVAGPHGDVRASTKRSAEAVTPRRGHRR